MDLERVIPIESRSNLDQDRWSMRDCLNCKDRTEHRGDLCTICGHK